MNKNKRESNLSNKCTNSDLIFCFPRTQHITNLGSATRDDLILDISKQKSFFNVPLTIEEKVDGANLGFMLDNDNSIKAQNRSHWVTSTSATQWNKLDIWIQNHESDLIKILSPPRSKLLFGEWLCVRHTVKYNSLPDYFLAFDIYDMNSQKFYSRKKFWDALSTTNIYPVNCISKSITFKNLQEIIDLLLLQKTSYDTEKGQVEGIYIRKDKGEWLEDRCKLVNKDFFQSVNEDEHWTHKNIQKNTIRLDLWQSTNEDTEDTEETSKELFNDIDNIQILLLMGLPGSGKTTFMNQIIDQSKEKPINQQWQGISHDSFGKLKTKKDEYEKVLSSKIKLVSTGKAKHLIIDQVNATLEERQNIISRIIGLKCLFVYFDFNDSICINRIRERNNHPTLPPERAEKAVNFFSKCFIKPSTKQIVKGFVPSLIKIDSSPEDINTVVLSSEEEIENAIKQLV